MKVDFLQAGSEDCPLIRLYDFRSVEVQRLRHMFESLANGTMDCVALSDVESVDGTKLTFTRATRDTGVVQTGPQQFDTVLSPDGWAHRVELLEPFCEPGSGYQWLCDSIGHIRLLISHDGSW